MFSGEQSTDRLEKEFGKIRMGCGGTYYINVLQVLEKTSIQHAKLLLQVGVELEIDHGHFCSSCSRTLDERESEIFEDLSDPLKIVGLEDSLKDEVKEHLVYITGSIQFRVDLDASGSYMYYEKYGTYLNNMSRGGLTNPVDSMVQWLIVCYSLFLNLEHPELFCRKSLSNYFVEIADLHSIDIPPSSARILSNILFNNLCKLKTPQSTKEVCQKLAKVSDS